MNILATIKIVLLVVAIPTVIFFLFAVPFSIVPFYFRRWRIKKIAVNFGMTFQPGVPWFSMFLSSPYERNIIAGILNGKNITISDAYDEEYIMINGPQSWHRFNFGEYVTVCRVNSYSYMLKSGMFSLAGFASPRIVQRALQEIKEGNTVSFLKRETKTVFIPTLFFLWIFLFSL